MNSAAFRRTISVAADGRRLVRDPSPPELAPCRIRVNRATPEPCARTT
ncbi:hypothetical protein [Microbispora catharanthi]|nr:hypothetical protein [Microbispora catharanthi]